MVDCCLTDTVVKRSTKSPNGSSGVCHHGIWGLEKLDDMLLRLPTGQMFYTRKVFFFHRVHCLVVLRNAV